MSFFSNLMSSLGPNTASPTPQQQQQKPVSPAPRTTSTLNRSGAEKASAVGTSGSPTSHSVGSSNLKRKAEDRERHTPPKKQGLSSTEHSKVDQSFQRNATTTSRPKLSTTSSNPSKPTTSSTSTTTKSTTPATQNPQTAATPTTASNKPAPKKNSYREIMARAALASQQQTSIGQIKHKAASKLSRRERQRLELQQHQEKQQPKAGTAHARDEATRNSTSGTSTSTATKATGSRPGMKPGKQPLSYTGTARPSAHSNTNPTSTTSSSNGRYTYYSSPSGSEAGSDDNAEDYDDYDYDDDLMEGGGFGELEDEEEMSLRAARKEDMQALMEEQEHRKEKLARKAALAELQKRRAGKS